jgi:hypothetical protein
MWRSFAHVTGHNRLNSGQFMFSAANADVFLPAEE